MGQKLEPYNFQGYSCGLNWNSALLTQTYKFHAVKPEALSKHPPPFWKWRSFVANISSYPRSTLNSSSLSFYWIMASGKIKMSTLDLAVVLQPDLRAFWIEAFDFERLG
jgi:hypothetical protein